VKLIFGMACDGPSFPDFPGEAEGAFDAAVVGPAGLLDTLEIQLGLTGPRIAHAVRIACYAAKLRIALCEVPDLFFARSFALDPWATAAALLGWRDQLVAAGWDCCVVNAERPDALARVEAAGAALPAGIPDRLSALCSALASGAQPSLARVDLVEPRHLLPSAWRRLLEAIEARGVTIVETPAAAPCAPGDLGRVQAFLAGQGAALPLWQPRRWPSGSSMRPRRS
jgi:ATP-dependent helicase/nuclease subunit B